MSLRSRIPALACAVAMAGAALLPVPALAGDPQQISYGTDGRLTVMIVGSDYRPGYTTERTDVVMVVSLDPISHLAAAASIPRDTVHVPRAPGNPGGPNSGTHRVNEMMDDYPGPDRATRLARFKADIALTLGVEIDYFAYLRFTGFNDLVDALGGVAMDIPKTIKDRGYNDYGSSPYGIFFPVATDYRLGGTLDPVCADWTVDCTRALPYVRSRHGKVGTANNSDWARAGRQQRFVVAAARTVASRADDPEHTWMQSLLDAIAAPDPDPVPAKGLAHRLITDMPLTLEAALQLMDAIGPTPAFAAKVVLKPSTWAYSNVHDPTYTYRLRLPKVRAWVDAHMAAVPSA